MKSFWFGILIVITCISILMLTHTYVFITTPLTPERPILIEIEPGTSAWEISRELETNGIITDGIMFIAVAVLTGKATHLQAGTYVFEGRHVPLDIMHILFKGRTLRYRITIPEGSNIFDIADIIAETGLLLRHDFIMSASSKDSAAFFGIDAPSMEGFLYPDTYYLFPHMTALEIMAKMVERFHQAYSSQMEQQADLLGMSRTEVITLASIIQKEAVFAEEKPVISSVFHNRIKRRMPLQSDPTAVYGIDNFHRRITPKDLQADTPYNTYRHQGLPPGPICNPDRDSMAAALWPDETPYLYFVSKGNGAHHFSTSLREHNQAIMKSRRNTR